MIFGPDIETCTYARPQPGRRGRPSLLLDIHIGAIIMQACRTYSSAISPKKFTPDSNTGPKWRDSHSSSTSPAN